METILKLGEDRSRRIAELEKELADDHRQRDGERDECKQEIKTLHDQLNVLRQGYEEAVTLAGALRHQLTEQAALITTLQAQVELRPRRGTA